MLDVNCAFSVRLHFKNSKWIILQSHAQYYLSSMEFSFWCRLWKCLRWILLFVSIFHHLLLFKIGFIWRNPIAFGSICIIKKEVNSWLFHHVHSVSFHEFLLCHSSLFCWYLLLISLSNALKDCKNTMDWAYKQWRSFKENWNKTKNYTWNQKGGIEISGKSRPGNFRH